MPHNPVPYTGFIARDGANIRGVIKDGWGWTIELIGTPGEQDGVRGFVLTGTLGEVPEALRIPWLDGEKS